MTRNYYGELCSEIRRVEAKLQEVVSSQAAAAATPAMPAVQAAAAAAAAATTPPRRTIRVEIDVDSVYSQATMTRK